jgi:hypothetical protein
MLGAKGIQVEANENDLVSLAEVNIIDPIGIGLDDIGSIDHEQIGARSTPHLITAGPAVEPIIAITPTQDVVASLGND